MLPTPWGYYAAAAAAAKLIQSCQTLCNPVDGSSTGSPIHGIFQARVLEWGAIAFSEGYYEVLLNKVSKVLNSVQKILSTQEMLSVIISDASLCA